MQPRSGDKSSGTSEQAYSSDHGQVSPVVVDCTADNRKEPATHRCWGGWPWWAPTEQTDRPQGPQEWCKEVAITCVGSLKAKRSIHGFQKKGSSWVSFFVPQLCRMFSVVQGWVCDARIRCSRRQKPVTRRRKPCPNKHYCQPKTEHHAGLQAMQGMHDTFSAAHELSNKIALTRMHCVPSLKVCQEMGGSFFSFCLDGFTFKINYATRLKFFRMATRGRGIPRVFRVSFAAGI